jgi:hypothetical protein
VPHPPDLAQDLGAAVIPIAGFDSLQRLFRQAHPAWSELPTTSTKHIVCHESTTARCGMPLGTAMVAADVVWKCSECTARPFCRAASCPIRDEAGRNASAVRRTLAGQGAV